MNLDLSRQTFPRSATLPSFRIQSGSGFPRNYPSLSGDVVSPYSSLNTNGYGMDDVGYDTTTSKKRIQAGSKEELQMSIDYQCPLFGMVLPKTIQRYNADGNAGLMHDMPMAGKSLSALNRYLKSEAGRRKYGGDMDCKQLVDDWQFLGVLMTDHTNDTKLQGEMVVTVGVDGRVRIPDIFAVGGKRSARVNDTCYLVYVRRKLENSDDAKSSDMDVRGDEKKVGGSMVDQYQENKNFAQRGFESEAPRHYWEIVPLCMPGTTPVPTEWYLGWNVTGHLRYLGKLTDVFRTGADSMRIAKLAKEAVFPVSNDVNACRKALLQLGEVELQLKMK